MAQSNSALRLEVQTVPLPNIAFCTGTNCSKLSDELRFTDPGATKACGSSFVEVLKTTVFLKDMGEFAKMNEVYAKHFDVNPPARSTVEVARLPRDVRVEIEAVAIVQAAR